MKIISAGRIPDEFFSFRTGEEAGTERIVKRILKDILTRGDSAVRHYARQFDGLGAEKMELSKEDIRKAYRAVDRKSVSALKVVATNIRRFAQAQLRQVKGMEIRSGGVVLGQKVIPLERVGCYIPGGRYPLPSSALMSVIPARVAGVEEVIVCSPKIAPVTVVAADIAGADRIFNLGGVQAIGAMAYGTASMPRVDKIVGPGNKYVTAAKRDVYGMVDIDFIAGPSEVMVIADESGDPALIAADLLAQAEHDPDARADFLTTSRRLAKEVEEELQLQSAKLKTKEVAQVALKNSFLIVVKNLGTAAGIANRRAPEHLELHTKNPEGLARKLRNYGSLFIGKGMAEVFGDYCSGTNHILPTNGAARYTGGLSVRDFVKMVTYQKAKGPVPKRMVEVASLLAGIEGLDGHRNAALLRKQKK